jgi:S-adenosylmethionine decarboxylase
MFIARRRFILKTCGTTTPLQCLKPLRLLVEQYAGFDEVEVKIVVLQKCS